MNKEHIVLVIFGLIIIHLLYKVHYKIEGMDDISSSNNEAIQNMASIYNNKGTLTIPNLKIIDKFNMIPTGCIISWKPPSGWTPSQTDKIPYGWVLCDGKNNAPDLRGRFLRMYTEKITGNDPNFGKYNTVNNLARTVRVNKFGYRDDSSKIGRIFDWRVGDTGGSDTVVLTTPNIPSHQHKYFDRVQIEPHGDSGDDFDKYFKNMGLSSIDRTKSPNGAASNGDWQHWDSRNGKKMWGIHSSTDNTGAGIPHNNVPPFYTLVFIMKT